MLLYSVLLASIFACPIAPGATAVHPVICKRFLLSLPISARLAALAAHTGSAASSVFRSIISALASATNDPACSLV